MCRSASSYHVAAGLKHPDGQADNSMLRSGMNEAHLHVCLSVLL